MSIAYQERIERERDVAVMEQRPPNYLQPTEQEIGEFIDSGKMWGNCKACKQFTEVEKVGSKYRCMKCHA